MGENRRAVLHPASFRDTVGLAHPGALGDLGRQARFAVRAFGGNRSRTVSHSLEFIMRVESTYGIELNEADVNACRTLAEIAALLAPPQCNVTRTAVA